MVLLLFTLDAAAGRFYDEPLADAGRRLASQQKRLRDTKKKIAELKRASEEVETYQQQSLPNDLELAKSEYQNWLIELVEQAKFENPRVDSTQPLQQTSGKQILYHMFGFTVRARGDMSQVTSFLYSFYRAGFLHQVRTLSLTPVGATQNVDMAVAVEAVSLPSAEQRGELPLTDSDRLSSKDIEAYDFIARRNLFTGGGLGSPGHFILLTAVTSDVTGVREAWFSDIRDRKTHRLRVGEMLHAGSVAAEIIAIEDDMVVVEMDRQKWTLPIGTRLAEAELHPEMARQEQLLGL